MEKYAYRHACPFILLPCVVTYPLNSLLIFLEQFCHPLLNELDHCALRKIEILPVLLFLEHFYKNILFCKQPVFAYTRSNWNYFFAENPNIFKKCYQLSCLIFVIFSLNIFIKDLDSIHRLEHVKLNLCK